MSIDYKRMAEKAKKDYFEQIVLVQKLYGAEGLRNLAEFHSDCHRDSWAKRCVELAERFEDVMRKIDSSKSNGDIDGLINMGEFYRYRGQDAYAHKCYEAAIELGSTEALSIYAHALELESNEAVRDGDPDMGIYYRKRAVNYYEKGTNLGDVNCISELAYAYYNGVEVCGTTILEQNRVVALELFRKLADMGYEHAEWMINKIANAKVDNGTAYCKVIPAISSHKEEA